MNEERSQDSGARIRFAHPWLFADRPSGMRVKLSRKFTSESAEQLSPAVTKEPAHLSLNRIEYPGLAAKRAANPGLCSSALLGQSDM